MANAQPRRRRQWQWRQQRPLLLCYLQCVAFILGQVAAQKTWTDSNRRSLPTLLPSFMSLSVKGPFRPADGMEIPIERMILPSLLPSDFPSLQPTTIPSSPTTVPSASARPTISMAPIISQSPTAVPSNSARPTAPILHHALPDGPSPYRPPSPTDRPSRSATKSPSLAPSPRPSRWPTSAPTDTPSFAPTRRPSLSPSVFPTEDPSVSPSAMPSSVPTLSCHDVAKYRSPINNLTCADHQGTDCTNWRYVGLTTDEVENLVLSCPISCNITCGSFWLSNTTIPFKMKNVVTFLSPAAVATLSTVSIEFLTEYVNERAAEPEITFYLHEVELLSQQIKLTVSPSRSTRNLQDQPLVDLLLEVAYRGVVIDLDAIDVDKYLLEGVDSPGYSLALRRSGDPTFANVVVTTDITTETGIPPKVVQNASKRSGVIAAAVVCSLLLLGAGGGWIYHYKRKSKSGMQLVQEKESMPNSPASDQNHQDLRSPASSFSFEAATGYVEKLVRQMASLSPRSFSYMSDNEGESRQVTSNSESSDSVVVENPYTGMIPPMIVIDHIDSDADSDASNDAAEENEKKKKKKEEMMNNVFPSLRIQASSELIRELHDENDPSDPATLASYVLSNASHRQSMMMSTASENYQYLESPLADSDTETERVRGSSFRVFSSEDDEDDGDGDETDNEDDTDDHGKSSAITDSPVAMMETRLPTPHRAAFLRPTLCDVAEESSMSSIQDPQHLFTSATSSLDQATSDSNNIGFGTSRNFFGWPRPHRPPFDSSPRSATASPILQTTIDGESPDQARTLSAPQPASDCNQSDDGESGGTSNMPRMKNSSSTGFLRSLWNRSPTGGRSTGSELAGNDREGNTPPSGEEQRRQITTPGHMRSNSKGSSAGTDVSEGFIYKKYQAPSKGKLGLVIECTELGPVVVKVKDYSPLLGQVQEGDRITEINGSKIGQTPSLHDVSTLLAGRSSWTNVVKLTIYRPCNSSSSGGGGDNEDLSSSMANNNSMPRLSRHGRGLSQTSIESVPLTDSGGRVVVASAGNASSHPIGNAASNSTSEQQQQSNQQQHTSPNFLISPPEDVARGPPMADTSMTDLPPLYQPPTEQLSHLQDPSTLEQSQVNRQQHQQQQQQRQEQQEEVSTPTRRRRNSNSNRTDNNITREGSRHFYSNSFSSSATPPLAPQQRPQTPTRTPPTSPSKAGEGKRRTW
jgi:hypothetical protein